MVIGDGLCDLVVVIAVIGQSTVKGIEHGLDGEYGIEGKGLWLGW